MSQPKIICKTASLDCETLTITAGTGATLTGALTVTTINSTTSTSNPTGIVTFPKESTQAAIPPLVIDGAGAFDGSQAFSNIAHAATQARTDAAAVIVSSHKFGGFITTEVRSTGLMTSLSNALSADPITIVAGIPTGYRPQAECTATCIVIDNNVAVLGVCIFRVNGNITIQPQSTSVFTNGQPCGFLGATYTYAMF